MCSAAVRNRPAIVRQGGALWRELTERSEPVRCSKGVWESRISDNGATLAATAKASGNQEQFHVGLQGVDAIRCPAVVERDGPMHGLSKEFPLAATILLMAVLMLCGCGDGEDSPTSESGQKTAKGTQSADYSLLLFLPKLAADLKLNAAQRVTLAVWRPDFHKKVRAATRSSGGGEGTDDPVQSGSEVLKKYGRLVEELLNDSQLAAFQKLRKSGSVSQVRIVKNDAGQIGVSYEVYEKARKAPSRFRIDDARREVDSIEDTLSVLAESDDLQVQYYAASWLLENREAAWQKSDQLRALLRPLADPVENGSGIRRGTFVTAFSLVADRRDQDVLRRIVEHAEEDRLDVLPAMRVLIRECPLVADDVLCHVLDDPWWRDETLRLLESMGHEAQATLAELSDILHPGWSDTISRLVESTGKGTPPSVVTEHRIVWSIEQFLGDNFERREVAMKWLSQAHPQDSHRDTRITCLLRSLLDYTWGETERPQLVTAYTRWASAEDSEVLLKLLRGYDADRDSAVLAASALLRLNPPLVKSMLAPSDGDDRFRSSSTRPYFSIFSASLSQSQNLPESTLLLLYEVPEEQVRLAVCRALGRVGTNRSVSVLSDSLKKDSLTDRLEAALKQTISRIRQR